MKRFFFLILAVLFVSCDDGKRPNSEEDFIFKISGTSILKSGTVSLLNDTEKEIATAVTDETGKFEIPDVESATGLLLKVCGGKFYSVATKADVDFSGCLLSKIAIAEGDITVIVDFLSTFVSSYDSETALEEWSTYLDITTNPFPELQSSLTDATKRYLWEQGLSKIAENVSKANSVTPESMYSTENLFKLLIADLVDDAIINGSTSAKFGALTVDSSVLKNILADAIPDVSETFTKADLKTWTDKIRNSEAKFLGGEGSGTDTVKPVITITAPAGVNPVISGTVTVTATATDDKTVASLLCVINGEEMPELTDTDETPENFASTFDSSLIADGKIVIKCTASDGTNLGELEKSAVISNSNTVKMKAYITNELTLWDSVSVYNSKNEKVASAVFEAEEKTEILLAPGIYRFVFKGGTYKPVFLADETIEFDSYLESRGEVKAGEVTNIIATPLTTLREYLYTTLEDKGDIKAEEKSLTLISEHIDSDFPLYIEPVSKNQLTENSKYYIVLAALERLAVLVGERHEPALEAGAITIEQVLKALTDDLEADSKAVLDGGASINQFPVDSYLFRYWYAIALKLFLESEKNTTGLKFSDLQTVISNISMDESELFPEAEEAKKVTDQPPVISEKQFKRSFETEYQNYSVENIIYANDSVFKIKFKALPDETGDLIIDLVELFGDVEVQSLSDINEEGIYTAEVKFPVAEDGEKSIGIRAIDNAENTGNATLQAVKDTVKPVITKFELLRNEKPLTGEYTTVPFTFSYDITEVNYRDTQLAVKAVADETAFSYKTVNTVKSGDGQISTGDLPVDAPDGEYIFSVKFTDKAGNEESTQFQKVIDRVSPVIDSIVMTPEINESGFINTRNITVEITAGDNIEQTLNYWIRRNLASFNINTNDPARIFVIEEPADAEISYWFKVSDQAGNESAESVPYAFTIDTVKPVIIISNKDALQAGSWKSSADELVLNYTIDELNRDFCEYRINGAKADDVFTFPTGSITFKSNPLLDPTIGPALPNTVSIYCIDKAGNETEEVVNVLIDDDVPVISIDPAYFRYDGSVVDPRIGTWNQEWVPLSMSDNFGRSKENLTVKYYYTAQITSMTGTNTSHRYPGSDFKEVTQWTDSFIDTDARCLLTADECQIPAAHPADSFLAGSSFQNMKDRTTAFVLNVEVSDKAGNKTTTSIDWTADKEPVLMESGGFSYDSGKIWLGFTSKKKIYSFTMTVNSINSVPVCESMYLDGMKLYLYSCPFTANTGTSYNVRISSVDYYHNLSTINCSDFDDGTANFCFTGSVKADDPQLSVTISSQSNIILNYSITSDSTLTECKILKNGSSFQNCSGTLTTGSKTESISTWDNATYTIKVSAKNAANVSSTKTATFVIDDTPTFFSLDIDNYKNLYYKSAPTLKVTATIAGGVKKVTIYLPERFVHKTRGSGFPFCSNQRCYETYDKKIFQMEPSCVYTPGGGTSCFFMLYTPPADLLSGFYERVRWVIESNMNGQSESGYFDLTSISKVIRVANSAADYTKINSVTLDSANKEMIVDFIPSIYSDASLSSSADFSFKILSNPDVAVDSPYEKICRDTGDNDFAKQYKYFKKKLKVAFDRFSYSASSYKAYFKPNLNSYFYGGAKKPSEHAFTDLPSCNDATDCPSGSSYSEISRGCLEIADSAVENFRMACVPNPVKHYTTDTSIADLNLCKRSDQGKCLEYYDKCFVEDLSSQYLSSYEFYSRCRLLRDFWYFPKNLKIAVTDDMGKLAEVTNSSSADYTSPEACPQQKKLDSF